MLLWEDFRIWINQIKTQIRIEYATLEKEKDSWLKYIWTILLFKGRFNKIFDPYFFVIQPILTPDKRVKKVVEYGLVFSDSILNLENSDASLVYGNLLLKLKFFIHEIYSTHVLLIKRILPDCPFKKSLRPAEFSILPISEKGSFYSEASLRW